MAELTTQKRQEAWAELMQGLHELGDIDIDKNDLLAVVNAMDTGLNDNAASINGWIPQPARNILTTQQKAFILMLIVKYRYLDGA